MGPILAGRAAYQRRPHVRRRSSKAASHPVGRSNAEGHRRPDRTMTSRLRWRSRSDAVIAGVRHLASVGSPDSAGVGVSTAAARAPAAASPHQGLKRRRLRLRHDRPEGQRRPVGFVAVGDPADRVPEDLHRRLRRVLVVVRRAGLAEVLELPRLLSASLDVQPRLDPRELEERLKPGVRPGATAPEDLAFGPRVGRRLAPGVLTVRMVRKEGVSTERSAATVKSAGIEAWKDDRDQFGSVGKSVGAI